MALSGAFRAMISPLWSLWTKVDDPRSTVHSAIKYVQVFELAFSCLWNYIRWCQQVRSGIWICLQSVCGAKVDVSCKFFPGIQLAFEVYEVPRPMALSSICMDLSLPADLRRGCQYVRSGL